MLLYKMYFLKRLKIIFLLLLLFSGITVWRSCTPSYIPANYYLIGEDVEKFGYGLYSYILFTSEPDNKNKERCAELLTVFIKHKSELREISKFKVDSTINIIYLPLKNTPPDNFQKLDYKKQVNWVIANYNYKRAKNLLSKLDKNWSDGSFILSCKTPLSVAQSSFKEKYLLQNLSTVPASVGALWMKEFIQQSYQTDDWNEGELNVFSNNLKDAVVNAAKNEHTLNKTTLGLEENLVEWISVH